jgi:hypothetical protein
MSVYPPLLHRANLSSCYDLEQVRRDGQSTSLQPEATHQLSAARLTENVL